MTRFLRRLIVTPRVHSLSRTNRVEVVPFLRQTAPDRPERFLLIAHFDPEGYRTVSEYVQYIGQTSRFNFQLLNLWGGHYPHGLELPPDLDLRDFGGLFINSSVSYNVDNLISLDRSLKHKIADFNGAKVMMKQDEHFRTNRIVDYLVSRHFDLLLTCVSPESLRKVYPEQNLPGLRFLHTLTGYVSDELRQETYRQDDDRPIDIGYRGSIQPNSFGRLAYEKQSIGEVFEQICNERGMTHDISSRWEDRFAGADWFKFLGGLKGVLGVESGASIFDFDGEVEHSCDRYISQNPGASFEEIHAAVLAPHENNVSYNQISPRHFEAAACRTVQIMYEGEYSGIFQPNRHYLSLKRDLSNLNSVLERLMDRAERLRLTEAAYEDIIMNDTFHYSTLIDNLDQAIASLVDR